MQKFFTLRNFGFALLISLALTQWQFRMKAARHERISKHAGIVTGTSKFVDRAPGYVWFSFKTHDGRTISRSEKCGKETFANEYDPLVIIYNKKNPDEFDTMLSFTRFNSTYTRFFFFIFYPLFLSFFLMLLYRMAFMVYYYFTTRR